MSSLELSPSVLPFLGRGVRRSGPRAPRLAGSSEPGLAASRRKRLRVLHASAARAARARAPRGKLAPLSLARQLFAVDAFASFMKSSLEPSLSASFFARQKLLPRGPSRPAAVWLLRAWLGGLSPQTPSRPFREPPSSSLSLSASSLRGRRFCRAALAPCGWRAPSSLAWRLLAADAFESSMLLPRGPACPTASWLLWAWFGVSSPWTSSRPLREPLSSSHFRPLRCEAEASAAGALAPRGWLAPSSMAWGLLAADAFASFTRAPLGLSLSASSLRGRSFCSGGPRVPRPAGSFGPGLSASRRGRLYESPFRGPSLGLFVARPKFLQRGPSRPAAGWLLRAWLGGFSPRTPFASFMLLPRGPAHPAFRGHPQH